MNATDPITTVGVAVSPYSPKAQAYSEKTNTILKSNGITCVEPSGSDCDLVMVLGGDGFMLETLQRLCFPDIPIWGLNFGQVGLLMNPIPEPETLPKILAQQDFQDLHFPLIEAIFITPDGQEKRCLALNEIVVERLVCQNALLDCHIDGHLLNRFSGDGIIISTPNGSTAYSYAAGGAVVHVGVRAMILTPISPHRPVQFHSIQFPIVLPGESSVSVKALDIDKRRVRLAADGRDLGPVQSVSATFSNKAVRLFKSGDYCFTNALLRKIIGVQSESAL